LLASLLMNPASQPASQPANQPTSQPASHPDNHLVSQPNNNKDSFQPTKPPTTSLLAHWKQSAVSLASYHASKGGFAELCVQLACMLGRLSWKLTMHFARKLAHWKPSSVCLASCHASKLIFVGLCVQLVACLGRLH
jgi:hypothetical protein